MLAQGPRQINLQLKTELDAHEEFVKLPNAEQARVPEAKLRSYLLSSEHTIGRFKSRFFAALGFTDENWSELRERLLELAQGSAELGDTSQFGQKYLVSARLRGPRDSAEVVTVWIVLEGDDAPRLVTVYPR